MALLSIFLYQAFIFLYLHQKCTVTIQFCDTLDYNHSLIVLMPSQVGFPEAECYQAVNNKTNHNHTPCKLHLERKDSNFLFSLLQKSVLRYSTVLGKEA